METTHTLKGFSLIKDKTGFRDNWQMTLESILEPKKRITINNDSPLLLEELKKLESKETSRVYLTYGMEDIDFYFKGGCLGVYYSRHDGQYGNYFIEKNLLHVIIQIIEKHVQNKKMMFK